jgi:LPXTG-site transpeptidase (sortase) family protein
MTERGWFEPATPPPEPPETVAANGGALDPEPTVPLRAPPTAIRPDFRTGVGPSRAAARNGHNGTENGRAAAPPRIVRATGTGTTPPARAPAVPERRSRRGAATADAVDRAGRRSGGRAHIVPSTTTHGPAASDGGRPGAAAAADSGIVAAAASVTDTSGPVITGPDSANHRREAPPVGEYGSASADATTLLPPVVPDDRTAILPRLHGRGGARPAEEAEAVGAAGEQPAPKGVRVIPLRPVQTDAGYRSVYSEVTRTTPATVARTVARGTGEILITIGLIVLLFAAYEVWGKAAIVNAEQNQLDQELAQTFEQPGQSGLGPATAPLPGDALARLYIPRLNKNWVVVQGVTQRDIRYAPGHYPNSAMPGQIGNFSVAGHRNRAIFWDLDQLKDGDPIVVETAQSFYVYNVTQTEVVLPTAVQVVAPVPNRPGATPTVAMLTLTTCNPKFNNYQRLIVHAQLARTVTRAEGPPPEIGG